MVVLEALEEVSGFALPGLLAWIISGPSIPSSTITISKTTALAPVLLPQLFTSSCLAASHDRFREDDLGDVAGNQREAAPGSGKT